MINSIESWKDILGYESLYKISSFGRVFSIKKNVILKNRLSKKGFFCVGLTKDKDINIFFIHRLVATHFVNNKNNYIGIKFKDDNIQNCFHLNLEWIEQYEKSENEFYFDKRKKKICSILGKNNGAKNGKKSSKSIYCKELNRVFPSMKSIEIELGITTGSISKCCNGKRSYSGKHPITNEKLTWCFND